MNVKRSRAVEDAKSRCTVWQVCSIRLPFNMAHFFPVATCGYLPFQTCSCAESTSYGRKAQGSRKYGGQPWQRSPRGQLSLRDRGFAFGFDTRLIAHILFGTGAVLLQRERGDRSVSAAGSAGTESCSAAWLFQRFAALIASIATTAGTCKIRAQ